MPSLFLGVILIFIQKGIISLANLLDNQLTRSTFRSTAALVAMNGIVAIPLISILWILIHPAPLTFPQLIVFIGIAAIEVFYQFPYYKALRHADTSIVVSLFSLGKIFIPLFAFFIVHERLSSLQYSGFALIIICSLLISMESVRKIKFNRALIYMIPAAIVIALQTVLEKYNLNTLSVAEFFFWIQLIPLPFYLMLLVKKSTRQEVHQFLIRKDVRVSGILFIQNILSWTSAALGAIVLSILPVTIVKSIGSFQALFVNLISVTFSKKLRLDTTETILWRRIALFILTGIGIILTLSK
jgi:drug/metabolite transporter (DMT)-like permease